MIDFLSEDAITAVFERFKNSNPDPRTELIAPNDFTLLVAVVLSAQSTDKGVNKATPALFAAADNPKDMLNLGIERLEAYIKTIGLYKSKARHIIGLCERLVTVYGGKVPSSREDLESLPGVGRKSANVILNAVFGQPAMPVDTHLLRIAPRIGLSDGKTPLAVEKDLMNKIPACFLDKAHHWLVLHGRYVCKARQPLCSQCLISDICRKNGIKQQIPIGDKF